TRRAGMRQCRNACAAPCRLREAARIADRRARRRQRARQAGRLVMFELSWRGGATEARLHRRRPGIDDLPWGSIDLARYPGSHGDEARKIWSNGTFTEYASAAAFSAMTGALLECGAPVDLVAAAADIVVDELFH